MVDCIKNNKLLLSFLLCFILGFFIVVPNIIVGKGIYHLMADFDLQQIPFNILMNRSVKNGDFYYTFYNDIGSNFIGTFSFYNLFSIFTLIGFLFPSSVFPYIVGPLIILKYGICGIFSYLFLKRYVKNKNYAVIGALLYTFSGFQLTNMLFHFQDVIVFFPLLLYSFDSLVYDNKRIIFTISVFLCATTNWFFFIGEVVFLIIYYFINIICKEYKFDFNIFIRIIIEALLGVLMASFVLIPSLLFTISNPRIGSSWTVIEALKYPFIRYIDLFKGILLPADTMTNRSFFESANYSSCELFLPFVGLIYVFSYIINRPKDRLSIMSIILFIIMFIPIFNSIFVVFNTMYYARWFYMFILIMCLITVKGLEDNISINKGIIIEVIGLILLFIISLIFNNRFVFNNNLYIIFVIILSIISIISLYFINKSSKRLLYLVVSIFIFVILLGNNMVYKYKNFNLDNNLYLKYIKEEDYSKYKNNRFSSNNCSPNLSSTKNIMNLNSFNTNISGNAFNFYNSVGVERITSTEINNKDILSLLGVNYIINCNGDDYNIESVDSLPIGYIPNNYISIDNYNKLSVEDRINKLYDHVVLDDKQVKKYSKYYSNNSNYGSNFKIINNGFISNVNSSGSKMIVYQIPYDSGWKAYINGKRVNIENINNGLMGVLVNKGNSKIEFRYITPGFKIGFIITFISTIVFIVYTFRYKNTTE